MAMRPQDMTLAKNETATEFVVGLLWQLLCDATPRTPLEESALRLSKNHVRELVKLHDLDKDQLTPEPASESWGTPPTKSDELPAYANGQSS